LGSLPRIQRDGWPVIWIHCVSVGETQAARPLVKGLRKQFPHHLIAISTITLTGQNLAREVFSDDAKKIFYFPFDWRWTVRRTLKAINPAAVLIMETELWPGFLRECAGRQIPVAIVNGRLSEKSFRRYRMVRTFMSRVLSSIDLAIMQTDADAARLHALGIAADKTFVSGSLKFDVASTPATDLLTSEFRERFMLHSKAPLILAASTHSPEERIVIDALKQIIARGESTPRLMIAPRHPERFAEVAALIEASGLRWARRTASPTESDGICEVILLDSIGELQSVYSLATIVFVGGSIAKTGGHNILEPAAVGACVITGAHTYNFQVIVETFVQAGAIIQLQPLSNSEASIELSDVISQLLADPGRQRELGERARSLVNQKRGATQQTLELLAPMLSHSANVVERVDSLSAQGAPTV
jgi:3-deoxy-D-manno-octulosonic-acid transferase